MNNNFYIKNNDNGSIDLILRIDDRIEHDIHVATINNIDEFKKFLLEQNITMWAEERLVKKIQQ